MNSPPLHVSALFIMLVFGIAFFYFISVYATGRKMNLSAGEAGRNIFMSILCIFGWLMFTLVLTLTGILQNFDSMPPRILIVVLPPLFAIVLLVTSKKFMALSDQLNHFWLVYPQSFRIIVELILWMLYRYGMVPQQMTFEGRNLDVLTGLSAPFVAYYCFRKKTWSPKVALVWNIVGVLLLLNIVVVAVLSTPYPFRYFMNEPANRVIFGFPFVWLPGFVVPFALFMHVLSIHRLLRRPDGTL